MDLSRAQLLALWESTEIAARHYKARIMAAEDSVHFWQGRDPNKRTETGPPVAHYAEMARENLSTAQRGLAESLEAQKLVELALGRSLGSPRGS
jgi:hypothetical protein